MSKLVAVETTDSKYNILRHEPTGGDRFDDDGRSQWPIDQFTHRLIAEGSVRLVEDKPAAAEEMPASTDAPKPAASAVKEK